MRPLGSSTAETLRFAAVAAGFTALLLLVPAWFGPLEGACRLFIACAGLPLFVFVAFQVVERRKGLGFAMIAFLAGLVLELVSFAFLYAQSGVLRIVIPVGTPVMVVHESRTDFASCALLSIQVWTSGGDGSLVAKPSQGWLTAIELLIGYTYMATFIAILLAVLQQRLDYDRVHDY